jgi:hypothetical protein
MPHPVYVCGHFHVTVGPALGSFAACTEPQRVISSRHGRLGYAPCNGPVTQVEDPDGSLEAAYRVGGPVAVEALVRARVAG